MKIGICVEGSNDNNACACLIEKLKDGGEVHVREHRGYFDLLTKLTQTLEEFHFLGMNMVVVFADNDRNPVNKRYQELMLKCNQMRHFPCAVGIAIQAFEAWMLADTRALNTVAGKNIKTTKNPETIKYPKDKLCQLICLSSLGLTKAELLENIVKAMNIDVVRRRCKSFNRFLSEFNKCIKCIS